MKICEKCFNNTEIVEIIVNDNSKFDNCDIDNDHLGVKIFDTTRHIDKLEQIRDYLRPALELYDISINLPDTFSPKEGKKIETALKDDWSIFNVEEDKKYTNENLIVANNDWDGFCESLKYKNRFHNNMINLENLAFFLDITTNYYSIEEFRERFEPLYRSRIVKFITEKSELMSPPKGFATAGRLNSKWISVLYLSTKEQVSIEEVKPKHNDIIYIGKVKLQKNVTKEKLKIANLTNLTSNAIKAGDDGFRKYFVNYQTLKKIHKGITNPSDEQGIDYLPFQYLADYIRSLKYDGIMYESILQDGTFNFVFFDQNLFECVNYERKRVSDVKYTLTKLS
ncbi:RES family NAD+ phosphorylase [Staphylococcus aureus]|uniref:RES family NAD+ phosphorylase n=1 Tax=Staphylococcus aureus TaxID=1280 RepID=UPI0006BA9679|nr:RES family NAD+ phosphorylase [Staphylococcus aureus]MBY0886141.1 RES family NAD+ phosphorylase [Staphylococcus aureus]NUG97155.1 RES family NAD+ phosphorylase [Staphylococcus aureus]NUG99906.1 RES family NAD+ phosphorylase [Staphylococcus aureus]NUH02083.1 RES family NAD+ phosphorylase [Staphylococcus aureus]NUH05230.1 RES family NAD+ phosphorylase [Staphylococcus aureus]